MPAFNGPPPLNGANHGGRAQRPFHGALAASLFHLAASVALVLRYLRKLLLRGVLHFRGGGPRIPATLEEQARRVGSILDRTRLAAAAAAIRAGLPSPRLPRARSYDSDGGGSSSGSEDERNHGAGCFRYPPIHFIDVGFHAKLIVDGSLDPLQDLIGGLSDAQSRREAFLMLGTQQAHGLLRLSDALGDSWILNSDPCALSIRSIRACATELIITTKLVCLIWREFYEQSWELSQELREECFRFVVGQSVEKILEVAGSFSDASWAACDGPRVLIIFDTLVDVLYNIHLLPVNRSDVVAAVFNKMVNALRGMIEGIRSSRGSAIHPANDVVMQALSFFYNNAEKMQSMLATANHCSDMFGCWESKLKDDAVRMFPNELDERYMFLLNNTYYVWQNRCRQGGLFSNVALVSRLNSMIQEYKKNYFDECWVLLVAYLEGASLHRPRRSTLAKFNALFISTCNRQMTWEVEPELRYKLREEIEDAILPAYAAFSAALRGNSSRLSEVLAVLGQRNQVYTVDVAKVIGELFEGASRQW